MPRPTRQQRMMRRRYEFMTISKYKQGKYAGDSYKSKRAEALIEKQKLKKEIKAKRKVSKIDKLDPYRSSILGGDTDGKLWKSSRSVRTSNVPNINNKTSLTFPKKIQKSYDETVSSRLKQYETYGSQYTQYRKAGGKKDKLAEAQITLGYLGLRTLKGASTPFIHPIQTFKGFVGMVKQPKATAKGIVREFKYDPYGTGAETIGQAYSLGKIGGAGKSAIVKGKGFVSTRGRSLTPLSDVIEPKVLKGIKTFPTAGKGLTVKQRQQLHTKLFRSGKYAVSKKKGGYHATPKAWKKLETTKGTSEIPGTYISPSISPHFLKVAKGKSTKYTLNPIHSLRDIIKNPKVMYISPTKFTKRTARKGQARVPGKKTEIEAVIPPATKLIKLKSSRYIKYKGYRIPIDEFKTVSGLKSKKALPIKKATKKYYSSYGKSYKSPYRMYSPSYSKHSKISSLKYSKTKKYSPYGIKGTKYSSPVYRGKSYKYYPKKSTYRGKPYYSAYPSTAVIPPAKKKLKLPYTKSRKLPKKSKAKQRIPYYRYTRTLISRPKKLQKSRFTGLEHR